MKKILWFLLLAFITNLIAQTPIDFKEECYKYNINTKKLDLYDTRNLNISKYNNMSYIASILTSGNKYCDDLKVYYTIPRKSINKDITIQKIAQTQDFVTLESSKNSFLVGVLSKNLGLLTAYNYINYQQNGFTKHKPTKRVVFELKKVNFLDMYINYIKDYCRVNNNQIAPNIIYNELDFMGALGKIKKDNEAQNSDSTFGKDTSTKTKELNSGLLRIDKSICNNLKDNNFIYSLFLSIKTHGPSGTDGFKYTLWGDKWFLDNGYTINYPFKGFDAQMPILTSYLSTYMYRNNIDRGIIIVDKIIQQNTDRWTTGKMPWEKVTHSKRTLSTGVDLYSIVYTGYVAPLHQYELNKDFNNADMSLVSLINQFPALSKQLTQYTPDGHIIKYAYKKGSVLSDSHKFSKSWEVSKKNGFSLIKMIIIVAVVAVVVYVVAVYAVAASSMSFATWFQAMLANPSGILIYGGGVGLASIGAAVGAGLVAGETLGGLTNSNVATQNQTAFYSAAAKNILDQIAKSPSSLVQELLTSNIMFSRTQTTTIVSPKDYKTIVKYSPILKNNKNNSLFNKDEWLAPYGNYLNYMFYAYKTDLGQDYYGSNVPSGISNSFYNSMKAQNNDLLTPNDVLKQVIEKN